MTRSDAAIALALALLGLGACGSEAPATGEPRLVVLGGALTETVFALGAGSQVVAVDRTSVWPAETERLPKVGLAGQVSVEGVLAQRPSLVIADPRTSPAALDQLRAAGVDVQVIGDEASVDAARARIRQLGALLRRESQAEALVATLERELAEGEAVVAASPARIKALFLYARGHRTLLVGGRESPADAVLTLAGADNVMREVVGFQPINAESIVQAAPEVIVVPTRGLDSIGGVDGLLQIPGIALTPAGRARRVVAVDDLELLGFGPRLGHGVSELARALRSTGGR